MKIVSRLLPLFLLSLTVARLDAQVASFAPAVIANTAGNSVGAAIDDFNGDGIPDVATANFAPNTVSIGLAVAPALIGPINTVPTVTPIDLGCGRIDANASVDLVALNFTTKTFTVLTNNGSGVFSLGVPVAVGNDPAALAVADLDADGDADVVVANSADADVQVFINDGLGGFPGSFTVPVGQLPSAIEVADFNGDGRADLAVTNAVSNSVTVLLADGLGGFTAQAPVTVGVFPVAVESGDIDHDHDLDLVVANQGSDSVTTLRNDGTGHFTVFNSFAVANGPVDLVVADLDHRNGPDLAVLHFSAGSVQVYTNAGNGNFNLGQTLIAGAFPATLNFTDFDADDNLDLVGTNNAAPDLVFFRHTGPDNPFPGTGDDLALGCGVNAAPGLGVGSRIIEAHAFDFVNLAVVSPGHAYDYYPFVLAVQAFQNAFPLPNFLAGVWLEPNAPGLLVLIDGYSSIGGFSPVIAPGGTNLSYFIPSGLTGFDLMFQAFSLQSASNNGILAASDGATLRMR